MRSASSLRSTSLRWLRARVLRLIAVVALANGAPALAPAVHAATLFALVDTGELFRSTDHGGSWTVVSTLQVRDAVAMAARASATELYLASASGVVYRSTNAGASWTAKGGVNAGDVVELLALPDLSLLVLTAHGVLYRSTDQATSFSAIGVLPASDFVSMTFTTPAVSVHALTRTGSAFASGDGGANWVATGAMTLSNAVELRGVGATLYALSATGDAYRSVDAGVSWAPVGTLSQSGITSLTRDGADLVAATGAGEVATSADGIAWTWKGAIQQLTVTALANDSPATTRVGSPASRLVIDSSPPWPNPARAGEPITFRLSLPRDEAVTLELIDVTGRRTWARGPEWFAAGDRTVELTPSARNAGLHFLRIVAGASGTIARRVAVIE